MTRRKFKNFSEMSMSVTLKPKKNNMYKVTGVGSKMKAHGGIKKGEKFHDSEIDGMNDSGIKVKYAKPKKIGEAAFKVKNCGCGKNPCETYGSKEEQMKSMEMKQNQGMEEAVVNELDSKTLKNYIRKAVAPQEKKSAVNLASKGGFKLGSDTSGNLEAGEKEDKKAFTRAKGIQRAAKKLYSRTDKVNEYNTGVKEKGSFKVTVGKAKPIPGNPDYKGPQNPKLKVKLNKTPGNMKNEAIQRRMDRKTIVATDPATGKKVIKVAPKKEIDIGKGKQESFEVQEAKKKNGLWANIHAKSCLLYTSPSPRDGLLSRMPSSA